ncbi:ribonuclease III [Prevotella intermedia]|jgi:ribonuclease III|uniref:Ribonuclease 3 n=1 Tax=Prevotella intermedia TaxID=28131 RepID=A0AAJ3RTP8_PREIN|nr:ribonuclease III [Prevotella intermedia]ATV29123.1 ribonuclease III [Prevotella intermedia]ATV54744.1 ribonuclease III [Prevotella intermedia]PJI20285.1 ribonuclease III [Prevotella intermedia]
MLNKIIDRIKLPFRKEKELYLSLYQIIGVLPHNLSYYKTALLHKSVARRNEKGKPVNNERLEFLGDAILDAIVGDIVYEHFPGKREGFLTNTRSKIVQRETLNKLANDLGITKLILSSGHSQSHNSYLGGNAFEALVGALYLDHGYTACMKFMKRQILGELINIDKVAYKEVNFKSKLIEWTQKHKINLEFKPLSFGKDKEGSPTFSFQVVLEGIACGEGKGYSKKESQQEAAKITLQRIRKEANFADGIFEAKKNRLALEEPTDSDTVATTEVEELILPSSTVQSDTLSVVETQEQPSVIDVNEKESIIAEAEAKAFQ